MMKTYIKSFKKFLIIALLCLPGIVSPVGALGGQENHGNLDHNRAKLLAYILGQQLPWNHFSHKEINDDLSKAAFGLYLKQLDFQKKFLLEKDVEKLNAYSILIDDEINLAEPELPTVAAKIQADRVVHVREMVRDILSNDFDFSVKESFETDPDKLNYCKTEEELRERWKSSLKFQVLMTYLSLEEDKTQEKSKDEKKQEESKPKNLQQEARNKVLKSYETLFSRMLKETAQDHYNNYFNAVAKAFDPHTTYMPPQTKEDFYISMRGSLEGIGALLREEDGHIKVVRIIPGSAAYRQGQLHAEDIILKVAEAGAEPVDIIGMRIREAVSLIRGEKGTEVRLTIKKPDGTRAIIPIIRDVVQIEETFVKATILTDEILGKKFGYIKIPSFYRDFEKTSQTGKGRNSTDDVKSELDKFRSENINGLILDLRNNGGGALTDAVKTAGLFIKTGPIVQVKTSSGKIKILADDNPEVSYSGPMVVLVNKFSASASEILAGALQDYGRALIIGGRHTHGKGTVQTLIDLNRNVPLKSMEKYKPLGALKITVQKFYRVSGKSTQYRGVVPDILLPDRLEHLKTGEQQLEYSLPWDRIGSAAYTKWVEPPFDLAAIKSKSSQRVLSDQDFIDIAIDSKKAYEKQGNSRQSLNIDDVRNERLEAKQALDKKLEHAGINNLESKAKENSENEEDRIKLWLDELGDDAYVSEAMAVLEDLLESLAPGKPDLATGPELPLVN